MTKELREKLSIQSGINDGILRGSQLNITAIHKGIGSDGTGKDYPLSILDESDGTIKIIARAAVVEQALREGGIYFVDDIEIQMHPIIVEYFLNRFQNHGKFSGSQIIFTTHSMDILSRELLRRDQYYFVDKSSRTGATELYYLSDFSMRKDERIDRAYIVGKYGAIPYIMG